MVDFLVGDEFTAGMVTIRYRVICVKMGAQNSGLLSHIKIKLNGNATIYAAIYSVVGDYPDALLSISGAASCVSGENYIQMISPVNIVAGVKYCMCIYTASYVGLVYASGSASNFMIDDEALPFPDVFWPKKVRVSTRYYIAGYGTLASGGAGRLIGTGNSRLIGGRSPLIGGRSPLIG
jgi:hypothetical protein